VQRQAPHRRRHLVRVGVLAQHLERGPLGVREADVLVGDDPDERDLEHLREPPLAPRDVAEQRVERAQVQQGLVDVEGDHSRHCASS